MFAGFVMMRMAPVIEGVLTEDLKRGMDLQNVYRFFKFYIYIKSRIGSIN